MKGKNIENLAEKNLIKGIHFPDKLEEEKQRSIPERDDEHMMSKWKSSDNKEQLRMGKDFEDNFEGDSQYNSKKTFRKQSSKRKQMVDKRRKQSFMTKEKLKDELKQSIESKDNIMGNRNHILKDKIQANNKKDQIEIGINKRKSKGMERNGKDVQGGAENKIAKHGKLKESEEYNVKIIGKNEERGSCILNALKGE